MTSVYDGDTFTCSLPSQANLSCKIRVIGYNSEEIKDKRYSDLRETKATNLLEQTLQTWFFQPKAKRTKQEWITMASLVHDINPLWFERIASIASKYALVELMERIEGRVTLEIPNLRPSFERVLSHVYFVDGNKRQNLAQWMIKRSLGYPYTTRQESEKKEYTREEKTRIFVLFVQYMDRYSVDFSGVAITGAR